MANNNTVRKLRAGAVQMESKLGQVERNLAHATELVEQAAAQGAALVLAPELMPCGYALTPAIWQCGETQDGPSIRWLLSTAARLNIWLATTFNEIEGEDFVNSFVLASPDGRLAGKLRKNRAESFFFKQVPDGHVLDTPLAKLGVGICADNHFKNMPPLMYAEAVDLMLMPHAWPAPFRPGGAVKQEDIEITYNKVRDMAPFYARTLGIPAVFVNQCGPIPKAKWAGIITGMMGNGNFHLPGFSTIADSDGRVLAQLGHEEGVIVADVTLDPACKHYTEPKAYGEFLHPGSSIGRLLLRWDEYSGKRSYAASQERREMALATSKAG